VIELFSPTEPSGASLTAPAGSAWTFHKARFSFRSKPAPRDLSVPVRAIVIKKAGGMRIVARSAALALGAAQGSVGIRVTTGSLRTCARFDLRTVRRDTAGVFRAYGASASALDDCSDEALAAWAGCGDGAIEQPFEECEGARPLPSTCSSAGGVACVLPGSPNACHCCSLSGSAFYPFFPASSCCPTLSYYFVAPHAYRCVNHRCDQGYPCADGDHCKPDGGCCATVGRQCALLSGFAYPNPLIVLQPCCPSLECRTAEPDRGEYDEYVCCASDGAPCARDEECCTGRCGSSGTCDACHPEGGPCSQDVQCCDFRGSIESPALPIHCGPSGTCDVCLPWGAPCTDAADCCISSCIEGSCQACLPLGALCTPEFQCCSGSCAVSPSDNTGLCLHLPPPG